MNVWRPLEEIWQNSPPLEKAVAFVILLAIAVVGIYFILTPERMPNVTKEVEA